MIDYLLICIYCSGLAYFIVSGFGSWKSLRLEGIGPITLVVCILGVALFWPCYVTCDLLDHWNKS